MKIETRFFMPGEIRQLNEGGLFVTGAGFKYWSQDEMDGGLAWCLLQPTAKSDEDIVTALGWFPHYSGPGRSFSDRAYVRRTKRRVLVTQRRGLDV